MIETGGVLYENFQQSIPSSQQISRKKKFFAKYFLVVCFKILFIFSPSTSKAYKVQPTQKSFGPLLRKTHELETPWGYKNNMLILETTSNKFINHRPSMWMIELMLLQVDLSDDFFLFTYSYFDFFSCWC